MPCESQVKVKVKINVRASMTNDILVHISAGLVIGHAHVTHYHNIKPSILGACYEMETCELETKVMRTSR